MANARLEIVVKGRRHTAMNTTPLFAGPTVLGNGFLLEEHDLRTFEMPDHWIPNYLVTYQLSSRPGKRAMFEGGRERESVIESGHVDVIAPQEVRKFRFEGEARTSIVSIEPEVMQSMISSPRDSDALELIQRWRGPDRVLLDLLFKLRSEVQSDFPAGPLLAEQICTKLTEELIQRYSIGKPKLDRYKGGLPGNKLSQAMDYIDSYLDHNLTTDDIGRAVGLSKYHFGKAFSTSTGMTLHNFVLARRMRRSRELLVGSDLPLAQIADAVGFSSQSHFTTVFLERTGVTPGRYRSMRRPLSVAVGR
jgi:AraC family transcriptional regulator